jgi:hypothetical protein
VRNPVRDTAFGAPPRFTTARCLPPSDRLVVFAFFGCVSALPVGVWRAQVLFWNEAGDTTVIESWPELTAVTENAIGAKGGVPGVADPVRRAVVHPVRRGRVLRRREEAGGVAANGST